MIKDMTQGKPAKVLLLFSLPMLLSMTFQQLYNIADSVIAGKFIGNDALAAVGNSFPVTMLFIAIAMGASIGCSVIISQLFGLKALGRMKTAVWTSIIGIMTLAVVLTGVGFFVCRPLCVLLKTPTKIMDDTVLYLNIYIGGLFFLFLYNTATAIFNGLGDSKTPLIFLICSSLGNIGLDILFVGPLKMGVAGVAWATFIAQGISGVLAIVTLLVRIGKIKLEEPYKKFSWKQLKKISLVAVPSILQQSFVSVGQLLVQGLVNSFETASPGTIAGYSAAIKVNIFGVSMFNTMSSALSSYTAQNIGAGEHTRVRQGYRSALGIIYAICALFMILWIFAGKYMISLFVQAGQGAEVIAIGEKFLFYVAIGYPFVAFKVVTDGVLRGAGAMTTFMISTFTDLIVRVAVSYILAPFMGFTSICLSFPIGWVLGGGVSLAFYLSGKWKNKAKV